MSIDQLPALAVFARIIKHGSLSSAAASLGTSRSAISKQLSQLESKLEMRLINRSTRKLSLTEAGEKLLAKANQIDETLNEITLLREEMSGALSGHLKVTCSTGLGREHLVPALHEFYQRYPKISLHIMLEDRFSDLVAEQIDVAIRVGHLPSSSLVARRLGEMRWAICASPDYLRRHGRPQQPQHLLEHNCLFYQNSGHKMSTWVFHKDAEEHRISVQGSLSMNDSGALVKAAIDGIGILLIDRNMLVDALAAGQLECLLEDYRPGQGFPVYALYPARDQLPLKSRVFLDFLSEKLTPILS